MQLGKALEILGCHVLRMLDAEPAITLPMSLHDLAIKVEDDRNSLVADSVRANLQTGCIGPHHAILHEGDRMHLVREQSTIAGLVGNGLVRNALVGERIEKIRRARAKGTIGVGLEGANTEKWAA